MDKHSPAPWIEKDNRQIYANGGHIATVHYCGIKPDREIDVDEADANARLITAAPKMLQALQDVLEYGDITTIPATILDQIEEAIWEATCKKTITDKYGKKWEAISAEEWDGLNENEREVLISNTKGVEFVKSVKQG